jgi:hypothetical protein
VRRPQAGRALPLAARAGMWLALALPLAHRGDPPPLEVSLEARGGRLLARLDLRPAFPDELRRTFASGLSNVVVLQVALVPEGGELPASLFVRELDVRFDVWEETYAVTVKDPVSPRGRRLTVRSWDELRALLADARDLDVAPLAALEAEGRCSLDARVELNPVSPELLQRTREFIFNPPSGVRGGPPSRSVLGAMASYLLTGEGSGEVHRFRSRPFTAREVVQAGRP